MPAIEFACERCGTVRRVYRTPSQPRPRFCSRACYPHRAADVFQYADRSGGPDACWPWLRCKDKDGYGKFRADGHNGRAHRIAWEAVNGPIPAGLDALHSCDSPPCINPAHLFLGTNADNSADMVAKGRSLAGDRNPAHLRPERLPRGELHPLRLHPERAARGAQNGKHTKPERTPRGEGHASAKVTDAIVREIREAAANGESGTSIARRFGIHYSTVYRIIRGETWHHVT